MRFHIWALVFLTVSSSVYQTFGSKYDYSKVVHLSLLFYEAQRSGKLPDDNRIPWRGDSALEDKGSNGEDLTGGYYDAGDTVKFGFTMASTTTLLAWGCLSYKDAYVHAGEWKHALNALKWATDYFIKCHVEPNEFYGQVGEFTTDHEYWGRAEDMNMTRKAFKIDAEHPGSDLAGETSAALAAVSLVFKDEDPNYSEKCLEHAKQLFKFATTYRGLYHEAIRGAAQYYESTEYGDELTWSAVWLYKATGEERYIDEAEYFYMRFRLKDRPNEFYYNKKVAGVQVLFAQLTNREDYVKATKAFCDFSVDQQKKTPNGLVYIEKSGTLCHAANIAFVCLQAADIGIEKTKYRQFAKRQIDYMLGDSGRSFIIGFGENYPKKPFHAGSSCPSKPAHCGWEAYNSTEVNPQILRGALVSGPDENDLYEDTREDYIYNEVTIDYNAGFQSAVAGLLHLEINNVKL